MFLILLMYAFLASTFTIGQAVLQYTKPIFFIGFRMIIAGSLLLGYQYFFNRANLRIKKSDLLPIFFLSFVHIYIPYILEFLALQYISSAKAALLFNLSPFITALFAYYLFNEKLTPKKILGLIIGFLGFIPILIVHTHNEAFAKDMIGFVSYPEIGILLSAISASYAWILIKKLITTKDYSPITLNGVAMLIGGILSLLTAFYTEPIIVTNMQMFILLTILIIISGNFLSYNLYGYLLKRYTATFLSFAGFVTPLFAALFQWIFLRQGVSWQFFASCVLVSIGLYIFYQEELRQGYIKS